MKLVPRSLANSASHAVSDDGEFTGSVRVRETLKKPIFWEVIGLQAVYFLGSFFRDDTFSDFP